MRRACLLLAVGWIACASALPQAPDTVLVNGRIATLDSKATVAEALAIRRGRIVTVGSFARVKPLIARSTRVIDLHGRTVVPGLIDSKDYFSVSVEEIGEIEAVMMVVGGKVVYQKEAV